MDVLGLDIGGANLKVAHTRGSVRSVPFALWKAPQALPAALRPLLDGMPAFDALAVTMTGELCDCFLSRAEGVVFLLDAVAALADGRPIRVWTNRGLFVSPQDARRVPLEVASANWLALATWAGRLAPRGLALLVDVGTTTTDVIPLVDGVPQPEGRTDLTRLCCGELLYRGWRRTPLLALLGCHGAAEQFATTQDLYVFLELVSEAPDDTDTADGRAATRMHAGRRIARQWCAEPEDLDLFVAATALGTQLEDEVGGAIAQVVQRLSAWPDTVLLSGSGDRLARSGLATSGLADYVQVVSLADRIGSDASTAGCAWAVALLCQEREAGV